MADEAPGFAPIATSAIKPNGDGCQITLLDAQGRGVIIELDGHSARSLRDGVDCALRQGWGAYAQFRRPQGLGLAIPLPAPASLSIDLLTGVRGLSDGERMGCGYEGAGDITAHNQKNNRDNPEKSDV